MTEVRVADNSNDRKYYTQVQRIVWAKCRNPYDLSLWIAIKNIAGDKGTCVLSHEDLAALSMMSIGQVSKSAKYLMSVGLLRGKLYRDAGYPQKVWHFRIPDVWRENIEWAQEHRSIPDQTKWKKEWHKMHQDAGKFTEQPSPDDGEPSPYEGFPSPGEGLHSRKPSPGEAKNNKKNNKRQPSANATGAGAENIGEFSPPKAIRKF
jgi:hypothetical protein